MRHSFAGAARAATAGRHARPAALAAASLLLAAVSPAAGPPEDARPDLASRVEHALARARKAVLEGPELAGRGTVGERALAALVATRLGAPTDEAPLARSLDEVLARADEATASGYAAPYHAGILLMLVRELGDRAGPTVPGGLADTLARRLAGFQGADGGWGDMSRTEFAALGLRAAEDLGADPPEGVWPRLERFVRSTELPGGGWGYRRGEPATGSMTAGALVALAVSGVPRSDPAFARGLGWLRENFGTDANPGEPAARAEGRAEPRHRYYYLATLASLARVAGGWPEGRWAREGARGLLEEELAGGGWRGDRQDRPTEFAAMFLAEARPALRRVPPPPPVGVAVVAPDGATLEAERAAALARALGRWTGLRAGITFRPAGEDATGLGEEHLVLVLAGRRGEVGPGAVRRLRDRAGRGARVIVEGAPRASRSGLLGLAGEIAGGGGEAGVKVGAAVVDLRARLVGPAPPGRDPGRGPEVLLVGEGAGSAAAVVVAPKGLLTTIDADDRRSTLPATRLATNVFSWAVSR